MKKIILSITLGALTLVACKKENTNDSTNTANPSSFILIETTTDSDNNVIRLFAETSALVSGHNNLYFDIKDATGNEVNSSTTVTIKPMMDMGTMNHSAPVIQPIYNPQSGMHEAGVIFQMSSMGGTWTIDLIINGTTSTMNITVNESSTKMVGVYTGTDSEQYIIAFKRPVNWEIGMNEFTVFLYKRETMMSYLPVTDMTMNLTPEMVSMQHGSPNNISPVHVSNGEYTGTVNYTMSGDWRLHFQLEKNAIEIHADAFLDILF